MLKLNSISSLAAGLILSVCSMTIDAACDATYEPIKRKAPEYPRRAVERRIEGFARVQFGIDVEGKIRDPVIIESKPKRIFDRAAIRALMGFKFEPCRVDNIAVEIANLSVKFTFDLQD
jgi:protein TonB